MSEDLEPIKRIEILYNEDGEPVETLKEATWKYVTLFDDEGEIEDQYSVPIIEGVDLEFDDLKKNKKLIESFKEDEHPRDDAGKFTQSGQTRDRTFDRIIDKHIGYIDRIGERIEEYKEQLSQEEGKTMRSITLNMKISRMESNIKSHQQSLDEAKVNKESFNKLGLFEMSDISESTHKVGSKGFKNGVTKSSLKDWQIEFRGNRIDYLRERGSGAGISPEAWEKRMKGKTMIESNITSKADESIKELNDEIMHVWNNVMTDKQRKGVDVLKIYYSSSPQTRIRGGNEERTLGMHGGRKIFDTGRDTTIMISPSVLTMNLTDGDSVNDVLNTMIHEVNHSIWATDIKPNHEKVNKFVDKILEMGKENAITPYAGSWFDDLDGVKKEYEEQVKWTNKNFGMSEGQRPMREHALETAKKDFIENVAKAKRLIANETHSEYFSMVGSPTDRPYHTADTDKLQSMSTLIKGMLYD